MKRYNQYRDSEVQWLREVPIHWEVKKLKYLTSYMQSGTNLTAIQIKDQGKYPVYGGNGRRGFYDEANWIKSCIVIGRQGALCGNVHIVKEPIWATDHAVITMNNKTTNIDYLFYLALTMNLNQYASQTAAQPGIAVGTIKNVSTCLPPLSEQHSIVAYLDTKVNKIDNYIATAEKKIAALDELKQVTIANAVTHGIHPNVPMMDSGIRWIGKIPKHWKKLRAKNMFERQFREVHKGDEVITCFRDGQVTLRKNRRTEGFTESFKEIGYQGIRSGDLVIHQMDAFAGSIGVSDSDGKGTPVYICCLPKGNYNVYYYAYLLREMARTGFIKSLYRGIRERSSDFRFETFAVQLLPIPPLSEQEEIVSYINRKVAQIDKMRNAELAQIEKLKEYKQRLISDVVTGKVKV